MTHSPSPEHDVAHEMELRIALLETMRAMGAAGLNVGTAGNASVRLDAAQTPTTIDHAHAPVHMLITPSGLAVGRCGTQDKARIDAGGGGHGPVAPPARWPRQGGQPPSSS